MLHNKNFPPNTDPHVLSMLAVTIGFACVEDYNALEQSTIGNFLILVGQYILTHAAQQQLIESRIQGNNININSRKYKTGTGGPYINNEESESNQTHRNEIDFLMDAIEKIQNELNKRKTEE